MSAIRYLINKWYFVLSPGFIIQISILWPLLSNNSNPSLVFLRLDPCSCLMIFVDPTSPLTPKPPLLLNLLLLLQFNRLKLHLMPHTLPATMVVASTATVAMVARVIVGAGVAVGAHVGTNNLVNLIKEIPPLAITLGRPHI